MRPMFSPSYLTHSIATLSIRLFPFYHFLNMTRIRDSVYSRYHQASFLRLLWCHSTAIPGPKFRPQDFPTLHVDSVRAIRRLDPFAVGQYFSTIQWCVETTMWFILVHQPRQPTSAQRQIWSDILKSKFPANNVLCLNTGELLTMVNVYLAWRRAYVSGAGSYEASLHPLHNLRDKTRIEVYNKDLVTVFMRQWMAACLPTLRSEFTRAQIVRVGRGFGAGRLRYRGMTNPGALPAPSHSGVQEVNHTPRGPCLPRSIFCTTRPALAGSTCSICTERLDNPLPNQLDWSVTTLCGHYFHGFCLNTWVNHSARRDANACPVCRIPMCVGRRRHGVS